MDTHHHPGVRMPMHCVRIASLLLVAAGSAVPCTAKERPEEAIPRLAEITRGLSKQAGLLSFHIDHRRGRVWLEVPPSSGPEGGSRYVYVEGLTIGLGSNPIGLDRGQIGPARLIALRRIGGRVVVEEENLKFRAGSADRDERRAVRESFAGSILWGGEIAAEDPDGRVLVDFTSFVVRDAHGSAATLLESGQGEFELDQTRSALDPGACLAFTDNIEFEAVLTFVSDAPGRLVRDTLPHANAVTLRQHHSLLRLPDDGYRPRRFDPRAGSYSIAFNDYAAPLDAPLETRWIVRHRLEKTDPDAASSRVMKPIIYYVDRGAPEPVRSALLDGASWWATAFESAGFIDAFRVELLPTGAHPLDARYNVIQWVHRSTRGWSYGGGVIDPRTGEMIKGHVSLGSLRVRQDRLLFEGLAGTGKTATGAPDDPVELALARIRQLAAHEVGHTLGLSHNFAASTYGRASVMDYPAPLVGITDGDRLDFSSAYAVGAGAWDEHAIRYAYSQFPDESSANARLEAIISDGLERGLLFLTDADARPAGAAHPLANLWDNGTDPVEALAHVLEIRRIALQRFDENVILPGTPIALMHEVLVPVYLYHRYQIEAAAKVIGGLDYTYAVRGDGQPPARFISPSRQQRAFEVILGVLEPARLDLPEPLLQRMLPRPAGYRPHREMFRGRTGPVFDSLGLAATAAAQVVAVLLQPERAARLVDFHRRDPKQPGLQSVLDALIGKVFNGPPPEDSRLASILRVGRNEAVEGLIELSSSATATPTVRAQVDATLLRLAEDLRRRKVGDVVERSYLAMLSADIGRYLDRRGIDRPTARAAPAAPPGSPIGATSAWTTTPE